MDLLPKYERSGHARIVPATEAALFPIFSNEDFVRGQAVAGTSRSCTPVRVILPRAECRRQRRRLLSGASRFLQSSRGRRRLWRPPFLPGSCGSSLRRTLSLSRPQLGGTESSDDTFCVFVPALADEPPGDSEAKDMKTNRGTGQAH